MKKYILKKIGEPGHLRPYVSKIDAANEMKFIIESNNEDYNQDEN